MHTKFVESENYIQSSQMLAINDFVNHLIYEQ